MTSPTYSLRYFRTSQEARTYRHQHGCGGWIFEPETGGDCILFPPEMPPAHIFHHPAARGQSGRLIGS